MEKSDLEFLKRKVRSIKMSRRKKEKANEKINEMMNAVEQSSMDNGKMMEEFQQILTIIKSEKNVPRYTTEKSSQHKWALSRIKRLYRQQKSNMS